jgi:hypothetical protein
VIEILGTHGITQGQMSALTGFPQGRISAYKNRKHIPTASSTFQAFADGLGMPPHLRLALGLAPTDDSGDSQPTASRVDMPSDTFDLLLLARAIGRRGAVMKRREVLELAAKVGATAAVAQSEVWERLSFALNGRSTLDESIVMEMEARAAGFHRLEEIIPAPSLFKGLAAHIEELSKLLGRTTEDASDEMRNRLVVVAGESAVLAGWAASDMGDSVTARNFYGTAERAASEADDPSIIACALAYRSYIPSAKGVHGRARALLTDALDVLPARGMRASPGTYSWLAARHAEESAALGDGRQALLSWKRAEEAFSLTDPEEDRVWTRFLDENRFASYQIATYANLGKLDEAQAIAEVVLGRLDQPDRKKAVIVLEDIASAHLRRGSANEAARLASKGLAILRETEFTMWLPRFEALAQTLRRWQRQAPVRSFLEEMTRTKRQFGPSAR